MILTYDRQGNSITQAEWLTLFEDPNYQRVGYNKIGDTIISTIWLGINYGFGLGDPLIFETMIFRKDLDVETYRYSTEEQARTGHIQTVLEVKHQQGQ